MGDPRRLKKNYSGPDHPWQKTRLDTEKVLKYEFGLKNKTELWKATSKLKAMQDQAKRLIAARDSQSEKEAQLLLKRLQRLGLLSSEGELNDVLSLNVRDVLERRLQTVVVRKNLARSMKQSRQFITHKHVLCNDKVLSIPGYIVSVDEEAQINFTTKSALADAEHPVRAPPKAEVTAEETPAEEKAPAKKKAAKKEEKPAKKVEEKAATEEKPAEKVEEKAAEKAEEKKPEAPAEKAEEKPAEEKPAEEASA